MKKGTEIDIVTTAVALLMVSAAVVFGILYITATATTTEVTLKTIYQEGLRKSEAAYAIKDCLYGDNDYLDFADYPQKPEESKSICQLCHICWPRTLGAKVVDVQSKPQETRIFGVDFTSQDYISVLVKNGERYDMGRLYITWNAKIPEEKGTWEKVSAGMESNGDKK